MQTRSMCSLWPLLFALSGSVLIGGCGEREGAGGADRPTDPAAPPAIAPVDPKGPFQEGLVSLAGQGVKVRPFIGHQPQLNLEGHCLSRRDEEKGKGEEPAPLCFDEAKRGADALHTLRVEFAPGLSVGQAMHLMKATAEGAHFLIERTGSIYQVLDLQYAPRRGDEYAKGEVRVFSGSKEGHERLVRALTTRFPALKVHEAELTAESLGMARSAPAVSAPSTGAAPTPPGAAPTPAAPSGAGRTDPAP